MSGIHSFSHRQSERRLELRPVDKHKFPFDVGLLQHMFHNYPVLVEMGGVLGLALALRTDTAGGLRADEQPTHFKRRRDLYQTNVLPLPPVRPLLVHLREAFTDGMLKVLVLAGLISMGTGLAQHPSDGWIEGFAILMCVFIVAVVSAYNNHKQERAYLELASALRGARVSVLRGGHSVSLEQEELLVGDLVRLNPGAMVPADGVLVDQTSVKVDESSITGESEELLKSPADPFLTSGTELVDGSCSMLITAVGLNSAKGKLMLSLSSVQEPTKLQVRLMKVERLAAYIGLTSGAVAFLALLINFVVAGHSFRAEWARLIEIFIVSVTIVIVAIPEGLPLAVAISMAYSMHSMRADQNLVKVLSACETMGNATAICSDKTGTLTQNKMTVVQAALGGQLFLRQPSEDELSRATHRLLVEAVVLNSDRRVADEHVDFAVAPEDWKWEGDGGATESALLAWVARYHAPPRHKTHIMQLRVAHRERIVEFFPFSSAKKYSSVLVGDPPRPGALPAVARAYYKGAADRIIRRCVRMVDAQGRVVPVGPLRLDAPGASTGCRCTWRRGDEECDKWALLGPLGSDVPLYCNDPNHFPAAYRRGGHVTSATTASASAAALASAANSSCSASTCTSTPACVEELEMGLASPGPRPFSYGPRPLSHGPRSDHKARGINGFVADALTADAAGPAAASNGSIAQSSGMLAGTNGAGTDVAVALPPLVLLDQHPLRAMENMARSGLRCIALAYVDDVKLELRDGRLMPPAQEDNVASSTGAGASDATSAGSDEEARLGWTLIGLVGIKDPLRVETRDAVMTVQQAGIVVRMVTGDNLDTARFIARDCGIITHPRHLAMEGVDFRTHLEDHEAHKRRTGEDLPSFVDLVRNLRVMARCQPEDKLELVRFLKEHGEVVGVTGDGSNDGPALKEAHVGLAMGIAGTDVAKAAADIIILDDNFSSIVRSVMWGRSVFDNIRKFLQFQVTVNFCALVVALVGAIGGGKEPLKPIQLLWVNLVMDTMGALAIGTEIPKPTLLTRKAYRPDSPLISKLMWRNIIGQAACQLAVLLPMYFHGESWFPDDLHRPRMQTGPWGTVVKEEVWEARKFTWLFNTFVWMQLFNEINSRKCNDERNVFVGIFDNAWFIVIFLVSAGCQVIMVELLGSFARTVPQTWRLWLSAVAFGATQLLTGLLLRLVLIDPTEGQVEPPPDTFANAPWLDDPSLRGAMFRTYRTKADRDKTAQRKAAKAHSNEATAQRITITGNSVDPAHSTADKWRGQRGQRLRQPEDESEEASDDEDVFAAKHPTKFLASPVPPSLAVPVSTGPVPAVEPAAGATVADSRTVVSVPSRPGCSLFRLPEPAHRSPESSLSLSSSSTSLHTPSTSVAPSHSAAASTSTLASAPALLTPGSGLPSSAPPHTPAYGAPPAAPGASASSVSPSLASAFSAPSSTSLALPSPLPPTAVRASIPEEEETGPEGNADADGDAGAGA